ncbi:hypothetical protein [Photobacterium sp. 1_MG-2023]|uniref:hypothetical protein n=1 Tax=Photobacterium sp. 1_MG-2023 TaxID=3062646 RepID=UPI0026E11C2B|nr:hypothetical protein [Photobacterium sp. 1_MG-2023]MDO6707395.1 hypothetical protein [Photobacterium sp. 1_MG-2023]
MKGKRNRIKRKETNGYRKPSDYAHLSSNARFRLLYTRRQVNSSKEERLLKWAQKTESYKLQLIYYIGGIGSFMIWPAFGSGVISLFGFILLGYVVYRYIRMTWSYGERLTYEREYPVKTITEVHQELVRDGLLTTFYSVALTIVMYVLVNVMGL